MYNVTLMLMLYTSWINFLPGYDYVYNIQTKCGEVLLVE